MISLHCLAISTYGEWILNSSGVYKGGGVELDIGALSERNTIGQTTESTARIIRLVPVKRMMIRNRFAVE